MFRRGFKGGKDSQRGGEIQELHRSRRFTGRKTASVPHGCITGGRDSKEEIARRNADKPVVSASKRYLHSLRIIRCPYRPYRRVSVQHDYYTLYIYPCISIADLAMYLVNVCITDTVYRCVIRCRLTIIICSHIAVIAIRCRRA